MRLILSMGAAFIYAIALLAILLTKTILVILAIATKLTLQNKQLKC